MNIRTGLAHVWPCTPQEARTVLAQGHWANGNDVDDETERPYLEALAEYPDAETEA